MLNRRHLRIKVLQELYAYFQSNEENYAKAEGELFNSIERIYDLYLYLLLTFDELRQVEKLRQEENKLKLRPSEEDKNPSTRFIDNKVINILRKNVSLRKASELNKVNWIGDEHHEMFKKIMVNIRNSETYFDYMKVEEVTFESDLEFIIQLFKAEIANSSLIYHFFEEKSIHWMDDIDFACSMVLKTLKSLQDGEEFSNRILSLYKDEDDEVHFVKILFRKTIVNNKENEELIDELTKNWELERIAKMDILLMKMAITELTEFPNIPKKVTLNEYIEISKFYSTPKSNVFINGVLDKAVAKLESENKIQKVGRGLIN